MILNNLKEIEQYFLQNTTPYYFTSATNFNLIDIHNWVGNWINITNLDCYDTDVPHIQLPALDDNRSFESIEEINLYLLSHDKTKTMMADNKISSTTDNLEIQQSKALFLFFDEAIESLCKRLDINIILPPINLIKSIDNKITTTEIGNQVNVSSVPNVLVKVDSYQTLTSLVKQYALSDSNNLNVVIQTAFGDSGKTTFFIRSEADYDKVADQIECEEKVKVMKYINCVGSAIEGCATRNGTFVGPLLSEMIGFEELTPYKGGWCGNELYSSAFSTDVRADIHNKTERIGNSLYQRGYRGYFEVDYLVDKDDGNIYLGEINPRITGITAMTNMSAFCQNTIPLFLFHLLEYSDIKFTLDSTEYNQLSLRKGAENTTSQMVLKHTDKLKKVHKAPVSGVYSLNDGKLNLIKRSSEPMDKGDDENHAYVLRITNIDEYVFSGKDLAIIFLNCQLTQDNGDSLNKKAQDWLTAIRNAFNIQPLTKEEQSLMSRFVSPKSNKN